MNAECLRDLFKFNNTTYETRSHKLIQPQRKTTSNRLRTFSYLGSKLWNDLVNSEPAIANVEFDELIEFKKTCECPNTNDGFPYVWYVPCLIFVCILRTTFYLCLILRIPYFIYILLHCKYSASSRILAFWLMLSVLNTTLNKVYLILSCLVVSCRVLSCLILSFDTE